MSTAIFNTWQNTDGTVNYKCRAWVNFNGVSGASIRASGNVSSVTRLTSPETHYTVNFTTAMPDVNYSVQGTVSKNATGDANTNGACMQLFGATPLTTSSFTVCATATGFAPFDRAFFCINVIR